MLGKNEHKVGGNDTKCTWGWGGGCGRGYKKRGPFLELEKTLKYQ